MRDLPYQDLGFAKVDHHRPLRTGSPEVVLGKGKTPAQVTGIVQALEGRGYPVLVTKTDRETYAAVHSAVPAAAYNELAGAIVVPGPGPRIEETGVLVVTAGTADLPVAEEALLTAELMGCPAAVVADVGVAGLHRLLDHLPTIRQARVIIVVAGMDAALAGVVAGLVSAPVVAVPTSAGYGSSFEGLSALLEHAEQLRTRGGRGEHRQRVRRGLSGGSDRVPAPGQLPSGPLKQQETGRIVRAIRLLGNLPVADLLAAGLPDHLPHIRSAVMRTICQPTESTAESGLSSQ